MADRIGREEGALCSFIMQRFVSSDWLNLLRRIKGKWMINREIHDFYANMESLNGDIACPGLSKHWNYYDGGAREWVILSDLKIECHGSRCDSDEDNCEKHDCDENAYCTVNPFVKDGYVCNCLDGYDGNGKTCRLPCTAEGGLDDEHYKVVVDEDNAGYIDQVKIHKYN